MNLSKRLDYLMKKLNLTQVQIAEIGDVTRQNISNIINNRSNPSADLMSKLLVTYPAINARWLLTGEGEMFLKKSEYSQIGTESGVREPKPIYECESCNLLKQHIERQNKLIDHYEKQFGQDNQKKAN